MLVLYVPELVMFSSDHMYVFTIVCSIIPAFMYLPKCPDVTFTPYMICCTSRMLPSASDTSVRRLHVRSEYQFVHQIEVQRNLSRPVKTCM